MYQSNNKFQVCKKVTYSYYTNYAIKNMCINQFQKIYIIESYILNVAIP